MGNLFCSEYAIHRRFDLKGSSHGRTTDKPEAEIDPTTTLKDLDLNYIFRLQKVWFQELCRLIFILITFSLICFFSIFFINIWNGVGFGRRGGVKMLVASILMYDICLICKLNLVCLG